MSTSWQTLNPPVDLFRMTPAQLSNLDPALPPGETALEVILVSENSCAVKAARLRVLGRKKRVLGRGAAPRVPAEVKLHAVVLDQSIAPGLPLGPERVTMVFWTEIRPREVSYVRPPETLALVELDPVPKKPAVWSPPPVSNHTCDPPQADVVFTSLPLRTPSLLADLREVNPFGTEQVALAELVGAIRTGMPAPAEAGLEVPGRAEVRWPVDLRLMGPRLKVGLPVLQ